MGKIDAKHALDLPHQVCAHSKSADLAANRSVKRFVKIVAATQPDIGVEPVIIFRDTLVELALQRNRKVVCDLRLGRVKYSIDRGAASFAFEMKRIYARTQSVQFHVNVIFNNPGNFLSDAAAQRTDWNIWVTFGTSQSVADPVDNVLPDGVLDCVLVAKSGGDIGADGIRERGNEIVVREVLTHPVAQCRGDVRAECIRE